MKKQEIARFNAITRGRILLIDNDTLLITLPLYIPLKPQYNDVYDNIYACMIRQYQQTGQITIDKKLIKQVMVSTVYKFALRASVQAFNLGKMEIKDQLDKPISYLSQGKDADSILNCTNLFNVMSDNSSILTILLPADITAMHDVIHNFSDISVKPKKAIKDRKALGSDPLPGLWKKMDVLEKQLGNLFKSQLPDFYVDWSDNLKIGKPDGRRRISLQIKYVDASSNVPLHKIKSTVTRGDIIHKKFSTKIGNVRFLSLDAGKYTITSEHPLYNTDTKTNVGINDTSVTSLEIRMKAIETSGTLVLNVYKKATNEPMGLVVFTIPKLSYTGRTNDFGTITKKNFLPGTYEGTITFDGYRPISFSFTIELNKTQTLDFYMDLIDS